MWLPRLFIPCLCYFLAPPTQAQDLLRTNPAAIYTLPDTYVLSELPLAALLKVKKSVNDIICSGYWQEHTGSCPAPHNSIKSNRTEGIERRELEHQQDAAADPPSSRTLSDIKKFFVGDEMAPTSAEWHDNRKTYHEHGLWKGSEESGKIQKLFQFSVTALAFLAFGGYLLCMIVQAIKSKGTVYYHPYPSSVYAAAVKKKKPIFSYGKRRKRSSGTTAPPHDGYTANQSELDIMYDGLISAIGTYVNLTTRHSPA